MVSVRFGLRGPFVFLMAVQGLAAACSDSDDSSEAVQEQTGASGSTGTAGKGAAGAAAGSAGSAGSAGKASTAVTSDDVTWNKDIGPLVEEKCTGCHQQGGIAPFALTEYATAKAFAPSMVNAVESGTMPPFLAQESDSCQPKLPWAQDIRLSADQKSLLRRWSDAGAPEGNAADKHQGTPPAPQTLEREDLKLTIPGEIIVEGKSDLHTCVVLDTGLTEDSFVTGRLITAGNAKVLHHVVSYVILPGKNDDGSARNKTQLEAAVKKVSGAGINGRYDCFGGPNLEGLDFEMLDAWAPGGNPNLAPKDSGQPISKDALVLLDVHYHPSGAPQMDVGTRLGLMTTQEKPAYVSRTLLLGNFQTEKLDTPFGVGSLLKQPEESTPEFMIPPGAAKHVEEMTWTWKLPTGPLAVVGMGTHMHYVGRNMRVTLEHAKPTADQDASECLIETPSWDFNWQRGYGFDAPYEKLPVMSDGDVLRMRCVFDNTMDNRFVAQALADQGMTEPVEVRLGENTLDEMCLAAVGIQYLNL